MRTSIFTCLAIFASAPPLAAAAPAPLVAAAEPRLPAEPQVQPSRIELGTPRRGAVARLSVVARNWPTHVHVTLTFALVARAEGPTEVGLPISLAHGVAVARFALETERGPELGYVQNASAARASYERTVEILRDPALLEWKASTRGAERLDLRVFPVTREVPATITIELALPYGAPLVLAPGTSGLRDVSVDLDGTPRIQRVGRALTLGLGDVVDEPNPTEDVRAHVDRTASLLALPVAAPRAPFLEDSGRLSRDFHPHIPTTPHHLQFVTEGTVAALARLHAAQLANCAALAEPRARPSAASLALSIRGDGTVAHVDVEDLEDDRISNCVASEVASWQFPAIAHARTLRHALAL